MRLGLAKGKIPIENIIYYQWQACLSFFSSIASDICGRYLPQKKGPLTLSQQSFFIFLQHVKRSARHFWFCLLGPKLIMIAAIGIWSHRDLFRYGAIPIKPTLKNSA
jgi:hypothetical protein